jgi:hypothetical protein
MSGMGKPYWPSAKDGGSKMARRPRDEAFFVRVAVDTHRYHFDLNQYVGALTALLGGDFGDWRRC